MANLSREVLEAALEGLEARRARLDERITELRKQVGGATRQMAEAPKPRKRRRLSAAGRKRIADAARKRWAALRRESANSAKAAGKKAAAKKTA